MDRTHGRFEAWPVFLFNQVRINPFRQIVCNQVHSGLGRAMYTLVGQTGGQRIDWFDGWRRLAPCGVHDEIRMAHLALTLPFGDLAGHDPLFADRILRLQPARVGAEIGNRQKARTVEQLDAGWGAIIIGGFDRVHLAFHRCDFLGHQIVETVARTAIQPAFRHV